MSSQAETEKMIREKLEATGQFSKMRAMIVDASLQALSKDEETVATMFAPKPTLLTAKNSEEGKTALSVVVEYLEHLGLEYTVNVLKIESGMSAADLKVPSTLSSTLHTTGDVALLSLLAAGGAHGGLSVPHPLPTAGHTASTNAAAVAPTMSSPADDHHSDESSDTENEAPEHHTSLDESVVESEASVEASVEAPAAPSDPEPAEGDAEDEAQPAGGEDSTYYISKWRKRTFMRHNQVTGQQVQLEYLTDCTVAVLDELDSMTVDDCEGGELIIAACEGSVFLRNCKNMTVHVACKQLRTRDCENVDLHIFTSTDPVVEMSHHMTFRPFHLRLPGLEANFKAARLDAKTNRFVHVYDFTMDEPGLPKPHFEVKFPDHGVSMEDRFDKYGAPNCPAEIEDLVALRLMPAASSESGQNKSYNIKTGAQQWATATATDAEVEEEEEAAASKSASESSDKDTSASESEHEAEPAQAVPVTAPSLGGVVPTVASTGKPPIAVPGVAPAATPGGLDDQEYSDFDDDEFEDDEDDKYEVDEDDDDF